MFKFRVVQEVFVVDRVALRWSIVQALLKIGFKNNLNNLLANLMVNTV